MEAVIRQVPNVGASQSGTNNEVHIESVDDQSPSLQLTNLITSKLGKIHPSLSHHVSHQYSGPQNKLAPSVSIISSDTFEDEPIIDKSVEALTSKWNKLIEAQKSNKRNMVPNLPDLLQLFGNDKN